MASCIVSSLNGSTSSQSCTCIDGRTTGGHGSESHPPGGAVVWP